MSEINQQDTDAEVFYIGGREHETEPLHYVACGLDNIYLLNGFKREVIGDEQYITVDDLDGLWKAIALHLVQNRKILAPKEVRFLRRQMDMTQAELGARLRVTDQTVARWEKGETTLVGAADIAVRVSYLLSDVAQPEGTKIAEHFGSFVQHLVDGEEDETVTLRHRNRKWAA